MMSKINKTIEAQQEQEKEDMRIEWFGIDGALCLCFVLESIILGFCMINNVDFVIGKILPYGATLVTFWIFLKYITQVLSFSRDVRKKAADK